MTYQINRITSTDKRVTVTVLGTIEAPTIADAYAAAAEAYPDESGLRLYPLARLDHGESVEALADYVVRLYERWERRNEYACENPRKRTPDQREDLHQIAALSIIETLTADPATAMYAATCDALTAVRTYQASLDRRSDRSVEFDPDWTVDVLADKPISPTYPELDSVLRRAIAAARLTANQMEYTKMVYFDGMSVHAAADRLERDRNTVLRVLHAAQFKILTAATADPAAAAAFAAAGIDADTLADVLANVKRKARVK